MRTKEQILKDTSNIVENATGVFWNVVANLVPEAKTGGIDPTWENEFTSQCKDVVKHWIESNIIEGSRNYNVNRPLDGGTEEFEKELENLLKCYDCEMQTETFDAEGKEL